MAARRTLLRLFALANNAYINSTVTFYKVDPLTKTRTNDLATLYGSLTGNDVVANPYTLDSNGKVAQPLYFESALVGVVNESDLGPHETGIVFPVSSGFRNDWRASNQNGVYLPGEIVRDGIEGNNTGNLYAAADEHESSASWQDDLDAGHWILVIDLEAVTVQLVAVEADYLAVEADLAHVESDLASTEGDAAAAATSAATASSDRATTEADAATTEADVITTATNAAVTEADVVTTATNRSNTEADAVSTNTDRLVTEADVVTTTADRAVTEADAATTTSDRAETESDLAATEADLVAVEADAAAVEADAATVEGQVAGLQTFSTIAISGQSNVVADQLGDTLTLVAGTGISLTTNAATDTITVTNSSTGTVDGPASSVNNNVVSFNGTTGKLIKDSGKATPTGAFVGDTDTQTLSGKTINASSNTISNLTTAMFATNVIDTDATLAAASTTRLATQSAVKGYVDNISAGLKWKASVRARTTTTLPTCTYANGTSGVGATLTGNANGALSAQDGVTLVQGERLLVLNESAALRLGIYVLTQVGDAGTPFILTRATDCDQSSEFINAVIGVQEGSANADTYWQFTNNSVTVGTTSITFTQFSIAYQAGTGLGLSGNTFSITDDELLALAGLTSAADKLPYFTGSGTASLADFTAVARTLLAAATALAQRQAIGLGSFWIQTTIEAPVDGTYPLLNSTGVAFKIKTVRSICTAGSATATSKINTTALGGTANSVTTSAQNQSHSSANSLAVGDSLNVTLSSVSGAANITLQYEIEF